MTTPYAIGTVSVTNGSNIVVGVGTSFLSSLSESGDLFNITGGVKYEIAKVIDDTHLSLCVPYAGETAASQAYEIGRNFKLTTLVEAIQRLFSAINPTSIDVRGTTNDGDSLVTAIQNGTARAIAANRDVSGASRPVVSIGQLNAAGGAQAALLIQQADTNQVALGINEDGSLTNFNFKILSDGTVTAAGLVVSGALSVESNSGVTFSGVSGGPMYMYLRADAGEDNADKWVLAVYDGGALTLENYSTGSWVEGLRLNPGVGAAFNGTIKTGGYIVSTLPAGNTGDRAYVTDATAPTYLGALTGGGAVVCPVFKNASAWVSA